MLNPKRKIQNSKKKIINFMRNLLENTQTCTNTTTFTKFTFRVVIICISRIRDNPCASIIFITAFNFGRFDDSQQRIRHFYQTFRLALNGNKESIPKKIYNQNVSKYVKFMKFSLVKLLVLSNINCFYKMKIKRTQFYS